MKRPSGHRVATRISRLISAIAPPLHSLHWKIFSLCLVAIFVPGIYLAWKVGQSIEGSHLRSTEEGMIDTALMVAEHMGEGGPGTLAVTREIRQRVFRDVDPNLRIVLYGADGRVVSDSDGEWSPGEDHSSQKDLREAMSGRYGARWTRDPYRRVVILHSAVPVVRNGQVTGIVRVIKTTAEVRRSVIRSLQELAVPALIALMLAAAASYALSTYLTRIIGDLAGRARRIAEGRPDIKLETWSKSELGDLARAVEEMRRKLEGKNYVEDMVTTLSHEIKTPLAAIRGAADILETTSDTAARERFAANIRLEVDRLAAIVDHLLTLSRFDTQPVERGLTCRLEEVAGAAATDGARRAESRGVAWRFSPGSEDVLLPMAPDSLQRLMAAFIDNALAFTPAGGTVEFAVEKRGFRVSDEGPGIPENYLPRVFDRFFTTTNPQTGRRGTGLGLAVAKSLADRHGAQITLRNRTPNGLDAVVTFRV